MSGEEAGDVMDAAAPTTTAPGWQDALQPRLTQRLLRLLRPGVIAPGLGRGIMARARRMTDGLPLLERAQRYLERSEDVGGAQAPIVYGRPAWPDPPQPGAAGPEEPAPIAHPLQRAAPPPVPATNAATAPAPVQRSQLPGAPPGATPPALQSLAATPQPVEAAPASERRAAPAPATSGQVASRAVAVARVVQRAPLAPVGAEPGLPVSLARSREVGPAAPSQQALGGHVAPDPWSLNPDPYYGEAPGQPVSHSGEQPASAEPLLRLAGTPHSSRPPAAASAQAPLDRVPLPGPAEEGRTVAAQPALASPPVRIVLPAGRRVHRAASGDGNSVQAMRAAAGPGSVELVQRANIVPAPVSAVGTAPSQGWPERSDHSAAALVAVGTDGEDGRASLVQRANIDVAPIPAVGAAPPAGLEEPGAAPGVAGGGETVAAPALPIRRRPEQPGLAVAPAARTLPLVASAAGGPQPVPLHAEPACVIRAKVSPAATPPPLIALARQPARYDGPANLALPAMPGQMAQAIGDAGVTPAIRRATEPAAGTSARPQPDEAGTAQAQPSMQTNQPGGSLDVGQVAEQVYDLLVRRLAGEREQRGW